MSHTIDRFAGKAKQFAGRVTDNQMLYARGKVQEQSAKLEKKISDIAAQSGNAFNNPSKKR